MYIEGLTIQQTTNVVQTLTTPPLILRALASGLLQHRHLVIRHESLSLLIEMLQKLHCITNTIKQWNNIDATTERAFKHNIMKVSIFLNIMFHTLMGRFQLELKLGLPLFSGFTVILFK